MTVSTSDTTKTLSTKTLESILTRGDTIYAIPRDNGGADYYVFKDNVPHFLTGLIANTLGIPRSTTSGHITHKQRYMLVARLSMELYGNEDSLRTELL